MDYKVAEVHFETSARRDEPTVVIDSPAGRGRGPFPLDPAQLEDLSLDLRSLVRGSATDSGDAVRDLPPASSEAIQPRQIGARLYRALFSGPVGALLERSRGLVQGLPNTGLRLRIRISPGDPDLAALGRLPWELLYDEERRQFLALKDRQLLLARSLDVPQPATVTARERPLRILVARSSPSDLPGLALEQEADLISGAWARDSGVEIQPLERASLESLREALASSPFDVLHFMGHGEVDAETGEGCLVFEDQNGSRQLTPAPLLADILRDCGLRLVVLNACSTASYRATEGGDPFAGVATALILGGIPAVVAMQFPISDRASLAFSKGFYQSLAAGSPVDLAVAEARLAVRTEDSGALEWCTPVLYSSAPEVELICPPSVRLIGGNPGTQDEGVGADPAETRSTEKLPRAWQSWSLGIGLLMMVVALIALFWPHPPEPTPLPVKPAIYYVRVQVLDPQGLPVPGSTVRASAGNEPQRTPDGWWEVEIPEAKVPNGGWITLWAEHPDWKGNRKDLHLGDDQNVRIEIRLEMPESWIRGRVVNESGRALPGVRVSRQDGTPGETTTDSEGRFAVKLPDPPETRVRLRAEHEGLVPGETYCLAGRDTCSIHLEKP